MDNIQFTEEKQGTLITKQPTRLSRFFIGMGWAKDERGAQRLMLIITLVILLGSIINWYLQLN